MDSGTLSLIFLLVFFAFLLLGVPITYSLGSAGAVTLYASGLKMSLLIKSVFGPFESFTLLAIFLFTLMGVIYQKTGMAGLLIDALKPGIGRRKGGLALVATFASAIFGALTGSANATCATFAKMLGPEMVENKYPADWTAATIAAAAPLGQLIPPSVTCIVLGVATGTSIGTLFIVDLSIGLITLAGLSAVIIYSSVKNNFGGTSKVFTKEEKRAAFLRMLPLLSVPVVVLGGMYTGFFTATEGGAIGSLFSLFLALSYKRITWKLLYEIFVDASKTTSTVILLLASSYVLSYVMSMSGMTQLFVDLLTQFSTQSAILGLLFLLGILLVMGCFIDVLVLCIILAPTAVNALAPFGVNAYHICAIFLIGNLIGIITPPVGVALFISSQAIGVKMEAISKSIMPYVFMYLIITVLILLFPDLVLTLPRLLGIEI